MRVLFIVPYPSQGQSNRFRVEQYLPALRENKIEYRVRPFYNSHLYGYLYKKGYYAKKIMLVIYFLMRRLYDVLSAPRYDVVFVHREAYPFDGYIFEQLFKFLGKKMIFDFDDSIFIKKPVKTKQAVTISDCVIVGNNFLKEYALNYNNNVVVLPTCIDTTAYAPVEKNSNKDKVVIGWIGTSFTAIYLELLKEVYEALAEKYKQVEFRVIGGRIENSKIPSLVCKKWSLESEVRELQGFDIGVMPLFTDDMAKGKCAFKIIEYMSVGIPAVASPSGMNTEVIEDGKDGFLVGNKEEWIDKLSILIENKDLREKMGRLGREKVERLYSVNANKGRFIDVLRKVYSK